MVAFKTLSLFALMALTSALAVERRAFAAKEYSAFQISDGKGGSAKAEAEAVFVDPFKGVDLKSVSKEDRDAVNTMAEAAVAAEEKFNSALKAGGDKEALGVGKTKNKVLKLTGEIQVLNIDAAQGKDVTAKLAEENKKLTENLKKDAANAGKAASAA